MYFHQSNSLDSKKKKKAKPHGMNGDFHLKEEFRPWGIKWLA